ncbi:MAG: endonuclease/exonuclease/phosphatase family protein [Bacteroidales bacterium]|nr:endonuclease/exonuclease/phosphatase family protein [Bacteroidales bacterium]
MKNITAMLSVLLLAFGINAQGSRFTKITVASWNIGHFALGKSGDTKLTHDVLDFNSQAYRALLNAVGADILALVEYNPLMVNATDDKPAVEARKAILSNYRDAQIGPKYSYNCNAVFSNGIRVLGVDTVMFSKMVQKRYYLVTTMLLDGDTVKVVSTHLDWNQGETGAACRAVQIQEIIEAFKNDKYVIMCGDWNVGSAAEYDAFIQAGYDMANHGYLGDIRTFPAGATPRSPLDNIIVKGFAVSHVGTTNNPLLSDHILIQADLTKLP